jgi:ATP-dependent Clp protease ATP-binding subunit ClpA
VIQEQIKRPLADDILFGRLAKGGHVKVDLKDGKLTFEIDEKAAPAVRPPTADIDEDPEVEAPVLAG